MSGHDHSHGPLDQRRRHAPQAAADRPGHHLDRAGRRTHRRPGHRQPRAARGRRSHVHRCRRHPARGPRRDVRLAATDAGATFGYYRLEILAAVVNAVLLFGVALYILWEAWQRWSSPPEVEGGLMLAFAAVGLVANIIGLLILRDGAKESLNLKGAYLEVLGDLLGSVAVIIAAVIIATTGWLRADAVASVAVALMILPRTWTLLREAVDVLLQATPKNVDMAAVREHILGIPGVSDAHDLHAWTLTSGLPVLSVHVVVADDVLADGERRAHPRRPRRMPGRALRRRALHLPARAGRPRGTRVPYPRLTRNCTRPWEIRGPQTELSAALPR